MKTRLTVGLPLLLIAGLLSNAAGHSRTVAQTQNPASQDKTPPSYDMKAQAIVDLQGLQKKYTELAESIPADKYTWRPEPGARSVSELFLHVASANYGIPTMMTGDRACPRLPAGRF